MTNEFLATRQYVDTAVSTPNTQYQAALNNHYANQQNYQGTYYYVDSVSGNDGNDGTTPSLATLTLNAGFALLSSGDVLFVYAPEDTPLREQLDNGTVDNTYTIRGLGGGKWNINGSDQFTSDWADEGGNVYSRVISVGTDASNDNVTGVTIASQIDSDGFEWVMKENTGTPTTPAAGEFGYDTDTIYLQLPDSGDANANTIEVATKTYAICQRGTDGSLYLYDCIAKYSAYTNIGVGRVRPEGGGGSFAVEQGHLYCFDCESWYASYSAIGGIATAWRFQSATFERCVSVRNGTDGFNLHSAVLAYHPQVNAIDCEAYENGRANGADIAGSAQGISPHDEVNLTITGGWYHHNEDFNFYCVGNTRNVIDGGAKFTDGYSAGMGGASGASLVVVSAISARNATYGMNWDGTGTFIYDGLLSGQDLGNGNSDDLT